MSPRLHRIFESIDNSSLVVFRILFGFLLAAEAAGQIATGWALMVYVRPERTFPMPGFEWLQPLPGTGMIWMLSLMTLCGAMVMLGWRYRLALSAYLAMWTYGLLVQTTAFNNHHYLIALFALMMLATPAHADCSWDARRIPNLRSRWCPRWCVLVLMAQLAIVYGYAVVAKLYPDWLAGRPVAVWFDQRRNHALVGALVSAEWFRALVVWGGLFFDALVVPLLLWRRTRWLAGIASVGFHLFNAITFEIGVFPFLSLACLVLFFPPADVGRLFLRRAPLADPPPVVTSSPRARSWLSAALAIYLAIQLLVPLRQFVYPGHVHWTEEGHRFSWLMMSRAKSGTVTFYVRDPATGRQWPCNPASRLTPLQTLWLAGQPDRIWQMAQRLREEFKQRGIAAPEVRARALVSLNGRPHRDQIDPNVDLASVPWRIFAFNPWITLEPGE